ncbi:unnamed protein product [Parnassius apollo]|uniref:(apollo) hypothetical protein n=1 Tax=Parnassius apollo TaxID=110799 RepID=A0A8S3WJM7_PARAO|nr:unnamed protein product [Parnassius apollo]
MQVDWWIYKKVGFELRGWASNQPELLQNVKIDTIEKTEVDLGEKEEKTLGLRWFTKRDSIGFRANLRNTPEEITRGLKETQEIITVPSGVTRHKIPPAVPAKV